MPGSSSTVAPEMMLVDQIFTNVPSALDTQLFTENQLKLVENSVLITVDEAKEICLSTTYNKVRILTGMLSGPKG